MRWRTHADVARDLGESAHALDWLANRTTWSRHYRVRWVPKKRGRRLIEAPLPRLMRAQRVLLASLAQAPLHDDAMGFRKGRGVRDHARRHARRRFVTRIDLRDFFATIHARRVRGVFEVLGLSRGLARLLAELTTNVARPYRPTFIERQLYGHRHLPQGAPTSPMLANLVAFKLDVRLAALARSIDGAYSRYADDLVISCDRFHEDLVPTMAAIAMEEGFSVQFRKTRVMSAGSQQMVTGLVVNDGVGLSREARKRLEATLFNCVRHGPEAEDRAGKGERFRAHLWGRVAHAEHVDPVRAKRLRELFERIEWPSERRSLHT